MLNRLRWIFVWGAVLATLIPSAHAAREARVAVKRTAIYTEPTDDSTVIQKVKFGQVLRVSEGQRKGWHKVLLPQPQDNRRFGWIKASDLTFEALTEELDQAGIQHFSNPPRETQIHRWTIMPFFDAGTMRPTAFQQAAGDSSRSVIALGFGAEFGYRFETTWTLMFRGGYHSFSTSYNNDILGRVDYSARTFTGAVMGEYFLINSLPWKVGFVLGAGAVAGARAKIEFMGTSGESATFVSPLAIGKITGRWYLEDYFGLMLGLGYQYIAPQPVTVNIQNVAQDTFRLNLSGPFAEFGLQFEF